MNKSKCLVVVGAQWGDEGKGKIIDCLAKEAEVVTRFQGGDNAGHTVVYGANVFKLHHIPSGILNPGTICLLGSGMVVNPLVLVRELDELEKRGIDTSALYISSNAHLVMSYHHDLDEENEKLLGENKIGTTGRGIGPAYADKALRRGLRAIDMVDPERFRQRLAECLKIQNLILQTLYNHEGYSIEKMEDLYYPAIKRLGPMVKDTSLLLSQHIAAGRKILFEGAQGALLDIDHGTYPYVTSSSTTAAAASSGAGIGPLHLEEVLGVIKAYTTRVGEGPFPTEEKGEAGEQLRQRGVEFGTTTGRPRRCGWFDAVVARYAARINSLSGLAVTKLDVLSGLDTINLAVAYDYQGSVINDFPLSIAELDKCKPKYEVFPGWDEDISGVKEIENLPGEARRYLEAIEEITGVPVVMVSVGADRTQTILSPGFSFSKWFSG